jgi:peptide/nickel transport system permease protein
MRSSLRFFAMRLAGALSAVLGASIISFVVLRAVPSDPARLILGPHADADQVRALSRSLGLAQSLPEQYWHYISAFVQGDWGYSFTAGASVRSIILSRAGATVELAVISFAWAFSAAVVLALLVTYRSRPLLDRIARGVAFAGLGLPQFWLGLLLLLVFSHTLGVFPGPEGRISPSINPPASVSGLYTIDTLLALQPATFFDALWHLALPSFCLSFFSFGFLFRLLRSSLLEMGREPFLLVVRGKGMSRWAAFSRHALPNSFLPTLTASALVFADLLGGSVLVETVFDWPGLGQFVVQSIQRLDYSVVQAFILLSAVAYVVVNLVIDGLYGILDPRIRLGRAQ